MTVIIHFFLAVKFCPAYKWVLQLFVLTLLLAVISYCCVFLFLENHFLEFPLWCNRKWIQLVPMRTQVQSLASVSESGIRCCCELQCRSQTQLGYCVAIAMTKASRCRSNSTPSLGTSICHNCGPKKQKTKTNQRWRAYIYCALICRRRLWKAKLGCWDHNVVTTHQI